MPVRICENCRVYYVAGLRPKPDVDTEHCRACEHPLRGAHPEEVQQHVRRLRDEAVNLRHEPQWGDSRYR